MNSPSQKRREDDLFDLHKEHCAVYYQMPPADRPDYIEQLIDRAIAGDRRIKRLLTNPVLVRSHTGPSGKLQKRYHFRQSHGYPTLPFEAHRFTMRHWGVSLMDALNTPAGAIAPSTQDCIAPQRNQTSDLAA